jgi:hypothetical protein
VWSVTEGQQTFDDHIDKLMNYIRYWQANGESYKTSLRVTEAHRQMVEAGRFRGGAIPYGYQTKPSGKFSKKGKELLELVIDPEQAEVVREIYRLVVEEGYGQNRIASRLNQAGIKTQKGNLWRSSAINALVKNPIYKGYLVYARGTDTAVLSKERQEALVMVEEATWQRAQEIRALRNAVNTKKEEQTVVIRSAKGSLLLIGMVRCGHCGSPLTSTWNKKIYQRSDGTIRYSRYAKYRCSGKALRNVDCQGKAVHSQFKLESLVVSEVYAYLDRLATVDLTAQIEKMKKSHDGQEERELQKWAKQLQGEREKLAKYKAEVIKVISGESQFSSQTLNDLIEETKRNIDEAEEKRQVLQEVLERQKVEKVELEAVKTYVPVWREVFENASNEKKKMMLSTIIGSIQVYREKIEIEFKLHINQFLGTMGDGTVRDGKLLTSHANVVNA